MYLVQVPRYLLVLGTAATLAYCTMEEGMSKNIFFRLDYHVFYVLYPFVTYLLTLPRTKIHTTSYSVNVCLNIPDFTKLKTKLCGF
jgi:hypothetical protein